ncbi:MAG: hypothetical protein KDA58_01825 [Planctomycetaceae bacterium]|nr:hypothetical protein [Planctomycetaceae bacterium]
MSSPRPLYARCVWAGLTLVLSLAGVASAQTGHSLLGEAPPAGGPVTVSAQIADRCVLGGERTLLLRGNCRVSQGAQVWSAAQIVLWEVNAPDGQPAILVGYAESTPEVSAIRKIDGRAETRPWWLFEIVATELATDFTPQDAPEVAEDPVIRRGLERRQGARGGLQQTQYVVPPPPMEPTTVAQLPAPSSFGLRRHVSISPRFLGERFEFKVAPSTGAVPQEFVATITGGVNVVVDNIPLQMEGRTILTRLDLTADRAVIWTDADRFSEIGGFDLDENTPFQVYLEGNIVVRQGNSDIRASHAFYDLSQRRGLSLNAEVRTYLPELEGTLRLRASELRQLSDTNYHARNAWFTTSQFGQPKWRVESSDVFLQERPNANFSAVNPFATDVDPSTLWVSSLNNRFFVEDMPVFYTPSFTSPAEDPHIPLRQLNAGYSGIFGAELHTMWNLDGLLGLNLPKGVTWDLEVDYLSRRGPAVGTEATYDFYGALLGAPAHYSGMTDVYYIHDTGRDNLGFDRRSLAPPSNNRGRILSRNRVDLPFNNWLTLEAGHIFGEDRNFDEQYNEQQWDTGKDLENLIGLTHQTGNLQAGILGRVRSNDFMDSTDWYPKADLSLLGEPLFGSPVVWSSHSSVGYGHIRPAVGPIDPVADPFAPLPYYATDSQGVVAMSRHELSLPFDLGPMHVVPYALGEVAFWEEDVTKSSLSRLYGSAGVRGSLQFSKYMPNVYDPILGLNGLAHKMIFDFDYSYSDSTEALLNVPQYNEFDENAQERFRERFLAYQFGGALPAIYDPRFYAVRSGAGRSVTAPYHELVDAQHVLRFGMHHRWQTKVGPPDRPRIIDWMELDAGASFFPNASRDNFGESFGLINGRYAWHVGPRTSLLASGVFDLFDGGQSVWDVGMLSQRSRRGSVYLGYRQVQAGPIDSQLVTGSFSYVMSPDLYVATFGTSFDVAEGIDRGQSLTLTRIGESWLLHFGLGYDRSKDNIGVALMFEPKFGSYGGGSMRLNSLLGIQQ